MNFKINTTVGDSVETEVRPKERVELSVVVTVRNLDQATVLRDLHAECTDGLGETDLQYEFLFVIEHEEPDVMDELFRLKEESGARVEIVVLGKECGSATALSVGVDHAAGKTVLHIPAFLQVEPGAISSLVSEIESCDLVVLSRTEERREGVAKIVGGLFRMPLRLIFGKEANDLRQNVVMFRKKVVQSVNIFGDKDRYLQLFARRLGFRVKVVRKRRARRRDGREERFSIAEEVNHLLDLLSVFFLTEFTKKPLRFFGFFGLTSFSSGFLVCVYLSIQRLFMGVPLADKPMLLLGILLIVLGAVFLSIGLIGEMIIFSSHKKREKEVTKHIK